MNSNSAWLSHQPSVGSVASWISAATIAVRWGRASAIAASSSSAGRRPAPAGRCRAEGLLHEAERHAAERVQRPVREVVGESGADERGQDPS